MPEKRTIFILPVLVHFYAVADIGVKIHDKMLNFWHFLIQIRLQGHGGPMGGREVDYRPTLPLVSPRGGGQRVRLTPARRLGRPEMRRARIPRGGRGGRQWWQGRARRRDRAPW